MTTPMHRTAREEIPRALAERGFAVVARLIPEDDLDTLAEAFRRHEEDAVPMSAEILFTHTPPPAERADAPRGMRRLMDQWLNPHRRPPPLTTRAVASSLRPTVEAWLAEPAVLFQDMLMAKVASHRPFPWHQDFPFWPVNAPIGLVVWAPLDPVEEASGGLALAERSHLDGVGPAVDLHTGAAQPGSAGALLDVTRYEVARPRLAPGDAIVFHPLVWHASSTNRAGRSRRVWASTWLGASARWSHARAPRHPLCRLLEDGAPVGSPDGGLG
jgi:ectoine hydroxylase-related dioxygenase (phytanoyl-CoA dioxygenase family)